MVLQSWYHLTQLLEILPDLGSSDICLVMYNVDRCCIRYSVCERKLKCVEPGNFTRIRARLTGGRRRSGHADQHLMAISRPFIGHLAAIISLHP